jgi:hypothetical protein
MTVDLLTSFLARGEPLTRLTLPEWETLLRQARKTRLQARIAEQAIDQGWFDPIPAQPRQHLEAARRYCVWQHQAVRWEVDCIGRALARIDTPIVLLKGAAYVLAGLSPAQGRMFSDIDILVARDRLPQVEAALLAHGWYALGLDAYDQRYYRRWMHELPPLQHVRRRSVIDVHHTITPPTSRFRVDASKLFAAARPIDLPGNFLVLAPADMVLHSMTHLFQEGEFASGLRDLVDVDDLLRLFDAEPGFWTVLAARAAELGLGRPLYYAVHSLRRLLDTPMPAEFLVAVERFRPVGAVRTLMLSLLRAGLSIDPPGTEGAYVGFARFLLYVRGHYLRMPLPLLCLHLMRKAVVRHAAT